MKVLELEIDNVRGVLDLLLKPNGKNFVIWGPNGSGKSAVVDALDFLLTGRVSRLTGKGTAGITLAKHGPHIDHKPEQAIVRAVIQLPGVKAPVEIRRCMAHPNTLEFDKSTTPQLAPIMTLAKRGQHVLTRREVLKYITAEAGTRAQEIQELLNISVIEDTRQALVRVQHGLDTEFKSAKGNLEKAKSQVNATVVQQTYQEGVVSQVVNQNRAVLGGQPIEALRAAELKRGLTPPAVVSRSQAVNATLLDRDIQSIGKMMIEQNQAQLAQNDVQLRELTARIRSDPRLSREFARIDLTRLGLTLIDETGNCPLCDKPWPPGELRKYLEQKVSKAQVAAQSYAHVKHLSASIRESVNNAIASVQQVITAAQSMDLKDALQELQPWLSNLQRLSTALSAPIENYPHAQFDTERVKRMLTPNSIATTLELVRSAVKTTYPETTPEQNAWDTLTRLEENLKAVESAQKDLAGAGSAQQKAHILLESFVQARDSVLGKLYDDVKDRFVNLYRQLHGQDEDTFTAIIEPDEAGLNFEVDFYGRGTHPPHALHSEGHQDSMGLCLYLALAEHLTQGFIDLVILDDVVMSVDTDHRRQVCQLLATSFPNRQFLITTHDKTWATQLRNEGVVDSQGTVEFYNWHIETGPQVNYEVDIWKRIGEDLTKNDVPSAASKLRRASEQFFGMACDALQAKVTYKLNGSNELGEFLSAAMGQYRALLKRAKHAAQSWNDKDRFDALQELDSTVGQIYTRSNAEQWAVNASVHYNNWANLSVNDFSPVVEAFQDLHGLFVCSKCGGMLRLATKGKEPVSVRCNCSKLDWNLTPKKGVTDPHGED